MVEIKRQSVWLEAVFPKFYICQQSDCSSRTHTCTTVCTHKLSKNIHRIVDGQFYFSAVDYK